MAQKKIDVIIDVVVDRANQSLGSFKRSIQDADGAAGKFKAGVGGAFDAIKANAGNLAMVGGAALIAFGTKAVGAFQDTALPDQVSEHQRSDERYRYRRHEA